ncbi:mechanosensitive ion channel [Candidatus Dependentiae bacterium]|nr:mechanosensitive ion channel [Candidatus Dependentiae bacterium]
MQNKKIFKIKFIILFINIHLASVFHAYPMIDIKTFTGQKTIETLFPTSIEAKQKQLDELKKYIDTFKNRSNEAQKNITEKINKISAEIVDVENKLQSYPEGQTELLNKKINILNERKQILTRTQDLWKETEIIIEKNIKNTKEIIEVLKKEKSQEEPETAYYSWPEFNQAQEKILELIEKIEAEKIKKENLIKQKTDESSNLNYLEKQINSKKTERKNLAEKPLDIAEKENLALLDSIFLQEINLLNEKIDHANLKLEFIEQEIKLKESEIELQQYQLNKLNKIIGKRITISSKDIEEIKQDLENTIQKTTKEKEKLNSKRDSIKKRKEQLEIDIENIKEEIRQSQEENQEITVKLLSAKKQKLESLFEIAEKELKLIDSQIELINTQIQVKEIEKDIRTLYYDIETKQENPEEKILELQNKRDQIIKEIKSLTNSKKEEEIALSETTRKIESINLKQEEIKNQRDTIFKNAQKTHTEIINILSETKKQYNSLLQTIQKNLSIYSDIINRKEKILNKLNFIISDLEDRQVLNIWKRSPKAISFAELQKSIYDAESFFKKLFWDTPLYLGPTNVYNLIKKLDLYDYLGFLVLIIAFLILFFLTKKILELLRNKILNNVPFYQTNKRATYFLLTLNSLIEFALKHLKLLFTWIFIYLHISFNFQYIFSLLKPVANSYSIALFYLISIPILIYLSSQLILKLRILNQKLSFLFFTEKSQSKFLFLITSILFATSILIPLRKAFLWYSEYPSEFPNVILAAYSLILIIVILLFFGKEDILTLIPSNKKIFIWLKNKINKYYYPVFIFFMGLLILSNPYIGYSNLAWYLLFAVPSTVFLIYGMFILHYSIRKYSISFFLKEEDEEIIDKFDYAKTYYGFFIITAFLIILFFNFLLISRIWRFNYTATSLWKTLAEDWKLPIGDTKVGIIQLLILIMFIVIGFLISTLTQKFVLNKLFDIFRTEPGTQNTFFRISHYIIISVSILLGFATIHLEQFILYVGGFLVLGLGISLKDIVTDFVAGFLVLIERTIEIGNFIQLDEKTRGTVHKIAARATTIRTAKNYSIIVPNKDLISKQIINWGQGRLAVGFEMKLLVSYQSDPEKVKKIISNILEKNPAILKVPSIVIRLDDFAGDGLLFFARAFVSSRRIRDQWDIASEIRFALLKQFAENNINIPYPQRVIHFSPNNTTQNEPVSNISIKFDR